MRLYPGFLGQSDQIHLLNDVLEVVRRAPLFYPSMPRTGRPLSVQITNAGPLGWISDANGYRYQSSHPKTGQAWPEISDRIVRLWFDVTGYLAPPEACLINYYQSDAKLGLHRDEDEDDLHAPVLSVSLGDTAVFRVGGSKRSERTKSLRLTSGDVLVLSGESRLWYHGVDRIISGSSRLIPGGGRINLTLRRVTNPRLAASAV